MVAVSDSILTPSVDTMYLQLRRSLSWIHALTYLQLHLENNFLVRAVLQAALTSTLLTVAPDKQAHNVFLLYDTEDSRPGVL